VTVLQRLLDWFATEAARRTRPFYDALRQDRIFLVSCLVGSYLALGTVVNAATGRIASVPVFLLGTVTLLGGTLKRLTDLELARIHRADTDAGDGVEA